ncbi:MAG: DUF262 domain-containing protein [Candidatus Kapaibacterium sp.]
MKATEARLLDFLKKSPQFIIPIYQRTYSWIEKECRQLWEDIIRAGSRDSVAAHFIGSIVYVEQGLYQVSNQSPLLVIDGQQRLTTVTLLIAALANALEKMELHGMEGEELLEDFTPQKLRGYYLLNPLESGERHFKLLLTQTDKESLIAIMQKREQPREHSIRVIENFKLFESLIAERKGELLSLCKGLTKLVVVDISLNRDQDNPQLIFESMNSTGRELTQADLIRNFILMGLEAGIQTRLYEEYWRPMEVDFGQEGYATHFDKFMRYFLTVKTGELPNISDVYEAFKNHARTTGSTEENVESLVADVRKFARYFCAMALGAENDSELARAFHDLRELKVEVAYPFLLELYDDYANGTLSREDFLSAVRLVESYVFRRAICAIPTNSLNKTFASFTKSVDKGNYLESINAHFLLLPSYRRFPSDEEFKRDIKTRDLYNFRSRSYWLRRIENHGRKERVPVDEYTIEHIMPQNEQLSSEWVGQLGENWEEVHQTWLHTLGNLTLTGYNSEYSDRPFAQKRDMPGGFKESPLKVNQGLGQVAEWNEGAIRTRADRLAGIALDVWESPQLSPETLATYRPSTSTGQYSIQDHPNLLKGITQELFQAFREEVLQLDPCVSEEYLKLYVAYKAETNFVDVTPQASRLRLALNMPFPDIHDPRGICKDVTHIGRWGNGDVEVRLTSLEELPYIVGLVRQALERQLGSTE